MSKFAWYDKAFIIPQTEIHSLLVMAYQSGLFYNLQKTFSSMNVFGCIHGIISRLFSFFDHFDRDFGTDRLITKQGSKLS